MNRPLLVSALFLYIITPPYIPKGGHRKKRDTERGAFIFVAFDLIGANEFLKFIFFIFFLYILHHEPFKAIRNIHDKESSINAKGQYVMWRNFEFSTSRQKCDN